MASQNSAAVSSERTVTEVRSSAPALTTNTLSAAHHFVSIKLTSRNFLFWRTQLVPFLRGQNLLGYVDDSLTCPAATVVESDDQPPDPNPLFTAWVQQDQSILSLLISSFSEEVMHLAVGRTTARSVWTAVEQAFGSSSRARTLGLLGQL